MRIKTLLCAASIAALAIPAMADNVYSLNIVGYVNMPFVEGLNLVATPLDFDGTGTNNWTTNLFGTQLPANSSVYTYNGSGYNSPATYAVITAKGKTTTNWNSALNINPGRAYWVQIPTGSYGGAGHTQIVTCVGTVLQGPLVNPYVATHGGGLGLVGNMLPMSGDLATNFNYQPQANDTLYTYNSANGNIAGAGYNSPVTFAVVTAKGKTTTNWNSRPNISVGQGFWIQAGVAGNTWSNNFTPSP